jgi:RNA polymerase sigma-70 factor (ECF subfamily)
MTDGQPRALIGERPAAAVDWATVYAENLPRVYNYCRFRTGDAVLAEDLTAQTFERAWRSREQYRSDLGAFSTWLLAIARNVTAAHFRHQRRGRELPLAEEEALGDDQPFDELIERRDDLGRLRVLLERLPAHQRELVELKYGAGLTNRAIAQLTGLSESNVGTTLHRVVRQLRAAWEGEL